MFDPFSYEFFVHGLIAATLAGGLCGLIGVYIVLRHMAYIGHGLAHAVFGGAVVSHFIAINVVLGGAIVGTAGSGDREGAYLFIGAVVWGFLSALLVSLIARKRIIGADAAIGIITTASFALGIALISFTKSFRDFEAQLFGNILGVTQGDLIIILAVTVAAVVVLVVGYKLFLFAAFEPEVAGFYGVPTGWMDTIFSLVLAAAIVASLEVLGVTMIAAAIVIPPIVARLLTNRFKTMILLSTAIGAFCGFGGVYASWIADVSSGPSVVLFSALLFVLVLLYSNLRSALPFMSRRVAGLGRLSQGHSDSFD